MTFVTSKFPYSNFIFLIYDFSVIQPWFGAVEYIYTLQVIVTIPCVQFPPSPKMPQTKASSPGWSPEERSASRPSKAQTTDGDTLSGPPRCNHSGQGQEQIGQGETFAQRPLKRECSKSKIGQALKQRPCLSITE